MSRHEICPIVLSVMLMGFINVIEDDIGILYDIVILSNYPCKHNKSGVCSFRHD